VSRSRYKQWQCFHTSRPRPRPHPAEPACCGARPSCLAPTRIRGPADTRGRPDCRRTPSGRRGAAPGDRARPRIRAPCWHWAQAAHIRQGGTGRGRHSSVRSTATTGAAGGTLFTDLVSAPWGAVYRRCRVVIWVPPPRVGGVEQMPQLPSGVDAVTRSHAVGNLSLPTPGVARHGHALDPPSTLGLNLSVVVQPRACTACPGNRGPPSTTDASHFSAGTHRPPPYIRCLARSSAETRSPKQTRPVSDVEVESVSNRDELRLCKTSSSHTQRIRSLPSPQRRLRRILTSVDGDIGFVATGCPGPTSTWIAHHGLDADLRTD
jgi:hypothetical protein